MATDRSGRRKRHRRHKQGTAFHKMTRVVVRGLIEEGYVKVAEDDVAEVWQKRVPWYSYEHECGTVHVYATKAKAVARRPETS